MAKVHGKGTVVTLGGDDLAAFSNSVTFTMTADSHDVTCFGADAHEYQGGLKDGTATIEGMYDNTATTGTNDIIVPLLGTVVEMVYQPEGTGVGKPTRTVEVLVTSYEESAPVADMITFTCELQMSGAVANTVGV